MNRKQFESLTALLAVILFASSGIMAVMGSLFATSLLVVFALCSLGVRFVLVDMLFPKQPLYEREAQAAHEAPSTRTPRDFSPYRRMVKVGVIALILVSSAAIGFSLSYTTIPSGYMGIVKTWGEATSVVDAGLFWRIPIAQEVVLMSVQVLRAERLRESAGTKDLQEVTSDVSVNFRANPNFVMEIYVNIGLNYGTIVVSDNIDEALKAAVSLFNAEELLTTREQVKVTLLEKMKERVDQYHIEILAVQLTDFNFSPQFTAAIEAKVTAQQNALKAQNDLERVKFEQQQKVIVAQSEANATITTATAQATAKIKQAEAEAEAIRLIKEQLAVSPEYLSYLYLENWNGVLPYVYGGGVLPFLNLNQTTWGK